MGQDETIGSKFWPTIRIMLLSDLVIVPVNLGAPGLDFETWERTSPRGQVLWAINVHLCFRRKRQPEPFRRPRLKARYWRAQRHHG